MIWERTDGIMIVGVKTLTGGLTDGGLLLLSTEIYMG
jgi:hypothetical protein